MTCATTAAISTGAMSRYGSEGWQVSEVTTPEAATGADLAIVVNPNNPDGRCWTADDLLNLGVVPDISYSRGWLRLGLPGDEAGWVRLNAALAAPEAQQAAASSPPMSRCVSR